MCKIYPGKASLDDNQIIYVKRNEPCFFSSVVESLIVVPLTRDSPGSKHFLDGVALIKRKR